MNSDSAPGIIIVSSQNLVHHTSYLLKRTTFLTLVASVHRDKTLWVSNTFIFPRWIFVGRGDVLVWEIIDSMSHPISIKLNCAWDEARCGSMRIRSNPEHSLAKVNYTCGLRRMHSYAWGVNRLLRDLSFSPSFVPCMNGQAGNFRVWTCSGVWSFSLVNIGMVFFSTELILLPQNGQANVNISTIFFIKVVM